MSDGLSVAEQLYVLVHDQVQEFVLTAALIGAVLGELRLQGRVADAVRVGGRRR